MRDTEQLRAWVQAEEEGEMKGKDGEEACLRGTGDTCGESKVCPGVTERGL